MTSPDRGLFVDVRRLLQLTRWDAEPWNRGAVRQAARECRHGEGAAAARRVLAATDGMTRAAMHALFVMYGR